MSGLLGSITGAIGRLFGNLLPSWGDPAPIPPKTAEPPEPEEEPEPESDGESDYETALTCQNTQNTETRWYSAIRRFLFWRKQGKDIEFYDGSTQWIGSENDFHDLSRDWFLIKANSKETLQEAHNRYNEEANAIFWKSGGQIDLRKTGTYASTSLRYFQDVARGPRKAENLLPEEDHWIKSAYIGGLTWAEPYEGIATELDFNEFYPNLLASGMTGWPIGPGEFRSFSHISTDPISYNLEYGIYRAFIRGQPAEQKCTRGFRYNPTGYYTHHDLKLAIDLGLHIELSSESPNALIYGQNRLMSGYDIFYQWARDLTTIKNEGGQAGKVAKHMLVSLWARLYSDGRRPGPHRRMAPFISAKGRKIISEKIRPLEERVKRIHTDGYIISGKATDQMLGHEYEGGWRDLKIVKTGVISIKNVMRLEWTNFEEIIPATPTNSKKSTIRYITSMPNEILDRIFQLYRKDRDKKMYPLLFVNKQWYYIARRLIWQRISLTAISGVKFTKALSRNTKPAICAQVLGLKFIGEIKIEPDVYISEVCKACPNLQWLSFENSGSRILNNKNLEALLAECPNLKRLTIRDSRYISPKTFLKIPGLSPSLGTIEIRGCLRIGKNIISDFQNSYPKIKLIIESDEE